MVHFVEMPNGRHCWSLDKDAHQGFESEHLSKFTSVADLIIPCPHTLWFAWHKLLCCLILVSEGTWMRHKCKILTRVGVFPTYKPFLLDSSVLYISRREKKCCRLARHYFLYVCTVMNVHLDVFAFNDMCSSMYAYDRCMLFLDFLLLNHQRREVKTGAKQFIAICIWYLIFF